MGALVTITLGLGATLNLMLQLIRGNVPAMPTVRSRRVSVKVLLLFVSLASAMWAAMFSYIGTELDAQHVVLNFDRPFGTCLLCNVDIFVNGIKIGSARNSQIEKFRLHRNSEDTYEIVARLVPVVGPNLDTETKKIKVLPGSMVYARFEIHPWVLKTMADVTLQVAIERDTSQRYRFLPEFLNESGAVFVASLDDNWLRTPWRALAIFAGAISAVTAIAELSVLAFT